MGKRKTKAIQTDLEAHNWAYPGIIQAYSKTCVTLAYLEPQFIQNPGKEIWQGLLRHLQ